LERSLLRRTFPVVAMMRVAIKLLPASWLLKKVEAHASTPHKRGRQEASPAQVRWAIEIASAWIPGSTCLVQALAGRVLLASYGDRAKLRVGVTRSNEGELKAHAWVELDGIPVVAVNEVERYVPFPDLEQAVLKLPRQGFMKGIGS
jgi:hypothetical protein